ncbi:unnamed protein product [Staurois parvus]|uniref:Uncharacterized protein n=1 Tax=Staurois parvus TaxID=386267 RepID=A0ABN9BDY1_9NEOB|nr:unnamed protein product [Staurois parvus]
MCVTSLVGISCVQCFVHLSTLMKKGCGQHLEMEELKKFFKCL